MEKAMFAAGCFWHVQYAFDGIPGVISTVVGYSGGHTKDPTYEDVCTGSTGHAETVLVEFDPRKVSYGSLVRSFFSMHDPTQVDSQGPDVGSQYRSAIFIFSEDQRAIAGRIKAELDASKDFQAPIATEIMDAGPFYRAEEHHQNYFRKNKVLGCAWK